MRIAEPSHEQTVGVRVPARPEQLTLLRALTETCLLIADLALDEVADVQITIDEVALALMDAAAADSSIECAFALGESRVTVRLTGIVTTRGAIDENGLGWHVVRTLTESLSTDLGPFDAGRGGHPVAVRFGRMLRAVGGPVD